MYWRNRWKSSSGALYPLVEYRSYLGQNKNDVDSGSKVRHGHREQCESENWMIVPNKGAGSKTDSIGPFQYMGTEGTPTSVSAVDEAKLFSNLFAPFPQERILSVNLIIQPNLFTKAHF